MHPLNCASTSALTVPRGIDGPAQLHRERGLAGLTLLRAATLPQQSGCVLAVHEGIVQAYSKDAYDDYHTLTFHLAGPRLTRRERQGATAGESRPGCVSLQRCDAEGVWDSETRCRWLQLYVPVSLLHQCAEAHFAVAATTVRLATVTGLRDRLIVRRLYQIAAGLNDPMSNPADMACWAWEIAQRWLAAYSSLAPPPPTFRERLPRHKLKRVCELIDARLSQPLRIAQLAEAVGMSEAHFARAFRAATGEPPHRHLMYCRAERARSLLDAEDRALADIALEAGFANQAHFTSTFGLVFGIAPGEYRRRVGDAAWAARHPGTRVSPVRRSSVC